MLPENVRGRCVAVDNESKNILVGFKDGTIRVIITS
jgi:hypothetical protein